MTKSANSRMCRKAFMLGGNNARRCIYIFHCPTFVYLFIALILSLFSSLILTTTRAMRTNKWKGSISSADAKDHRLTFRVQGSGGVTHTAPMAEARGREWARGMGWGNVYTRGVPLLILYITAPMVHPGRAGNHNR